MNDSVVLSAFLFAVVLDTPLSSMTARSQDPPCPLWLIDCSVILRKCRHRSRSAVMHSEGGDLQTQKKLIRSLEMAMVT